jgi:hypothetical protein
MGHRLECVQIIYTSVNNSLCGGPAPRVGFSGPLFW